MKKIIKKLSLNKQTMALLDEKEMMNVKGGESDEKVDATKTRLFCMSLVSICTARSCVSPICF